jgi:tetratricopeptide (TPR) repeat protein
MLLPSDSKFKSVWQKLVRWCFELKNERLALTYFSRVMETCKRALPNDNKIRDYYVWSMGELYEDALNFDTALTYYSECVRFDSSNVYVSSQFSEVQEHFWEQSLEDRINTINFKMDVYEKLFSENDTNRSDFLNTMGNLYQKCERTDLAYICCQKAFDINEASASFNKEVLLDCWRKLVKICFEKNDDPLAVNYLKRALKKMENDPSDHNANGTKFLLYMARHYKEMSDLDKALVFYEQALVSAPSLKLDGIGIKEALIHTSSVSYIYVNKIL